MLAARLLGAQIDGCRGALVRATNRHDTAKQALALAEKALKASQEEVSQLTTEQAFPEAKVAAPAPASSPSLLLFFPVPCSNRSATIRTRQDDHDLDDTMTDQDFVADLRIRLEDPNEVRSVRRRISSKHTPCGPNVSGAEVVNTSSS